MMSEYSVISKESQDSLPKVSRNTPTKFIFVNTILFAAFNVHNISKKKVCIINVPTHTTSKVDKNQTTIEYLSYNQN